MAQFLIPLAMGVPGLISGIMSAVAAGKQLRGGRVVRHYRKAPKKVNRRGKGFAADLVSSIPFLGSLAGPLVRSLGGRVKRRAPKRGKGLSPMAIYSPLVHGSGLLSPGHMPRVSTTQMPYNVRLLLAKKGLGLLAPSGHYGGAVHRRGHYRHINGKRVHVRPTIVMKGGAYRKKPQRKAYKVYRRKY